MSKIVMDEKEEKKKRKSAFYEDSKAYHKTVLDSLKVQPSQFSVKPGWFPRKDRPIPGIGPTDRIIGLFPNECEKGHDLYMELYDMDQNPLPGRPLYKWKYNPHYMDELPEYLNETSGQFSYIVPVNELVQINTQAAIINGDTLFDEEEYESPKEKLSTKTVKSASTAKPFTAPANDVLSIMDKPVCELTVGELTAIVNRKPISGNRELDRYIMSINN